MVRVIVAAGAWLSVSCRQTGGELNWQVTHDSHLCWISLSLPVYLSVLSERERERLKESPEKGK